ncbi:leucine-rich repeat domain-containing protein [Rhodobacter capsulatus]|uniref:leucine-rich repeat domain-containing protein n=1 Tax=Rhodobacter capsulatus TaxID=1061 RepID=UPI00068726F4|nr:leucine-rich repeat domain-containing protein [Rhodobacter capsulatus]
MTEAEKAYRAALEEIERVKREGGTELWLSEDAFRALDRIPTEVAGLTGLQRLNLNRTAVSDLTPLAGLAALRVLSLDQTATRDLSPLAGLTALESLLLDQTDIRNLTPLAGLTALSELVLYGTAVSDLSPLAGLTALKSLWLDQTEVSDLSPLAGLTALEILALGQTRVRDLTPLAGMTALKSLVLDLTQLSDLTPLAGLTSLETLGLDSSAVADLRPIRGLFKLGTHLVGGLHFTNTPATCADAELAQLAEIEDGKTRTRETLAYLNTLPPWPEPYLPKARPDGKPPEWIGAAPPAPPAIRTAETQIRALLRHAQVTRISAAVFAEQIATALREVPATNGNELVPVLQIMAELGEVLSLIARQEADARDAETRLRLRISQLEALVDRLTRQLTDAEKALEAEKALGRSEGFMAAYRKSFGEESGKWSARLVFVGVPAAMGHFLGLDNPVVEALNKVLEQLPKG